MTHRALLGHVQMSTAVQGALRHARQTVRGMPVKQAHASPVSATGTATLIRRTVATMNGALLTILAILYATIARTTRWIATSVLTAAGWIGVRMRLFPMILTVSAMIIHHTVGLPEAIAVGVIQIVIQTEPLWLIIVAGQTDAVLQLAIRDITMLNAVLAEALLAKRLARAALLTRILVKTLRPAERVQITPAALWGVAQAQPMPIHAHL